MNLAFKTKVGNHIVDFPYQTSTNLTMEVLSHDFIDKRIELIKENLLLSFDINDVDEKEWFDDKCKEISDMLNDDTLELIMI